MVGQADAFKNLKASVTLAGPTGLKVKGVGGGPGRRL